MSTLQEFFNQPGKNGKAKGIVQKNNILKRNIIAHMAIEGECTLADLARELHVSIPTVTKLVDELLADKIIADRGKIETSGGRRPNVFGLTHSSIYFAGIEISRDQMVLMLTDLHNNVIKLEHNADFQLDDTDECLECICQTIEKFLNSSDIDRTKLMGGPQAGIILGKAEYIRQLKRHPLARAMRVDKMTLAALEATLRSYAEERALEEIPTLAMLGAREEELRAKAQLLCDALVKGGVEAQVVAEQCQVGGGSVPAQLLPTFAVAIAPARCSVDELEQALRLRERPIIGRIAHDRYLLDLRTLREEDFPAVETALFEVLS